jgi:hypothetical protein
MILISGESKLTLVGFKVTPIFSFCPSYPNIFHPQVKTSPEHVSKPAKRSPQTTLATALLNSIPNGRAGIVSNSFSDSV